MWRLDRHLAGMGLALVAVTCWTTTVGSTACATPRGAPADPGGLRVLIEPRAGMLPIDELLRAAKKSVDLVMYELEDRRIESILAADARRGVDVRVILNEHFTESDNAPAFAYLRSRGVQVRWASSRFDITHEKSAVIDGTTALVMTMNFQPQYYATTRDVVVIDTIPADVEAISRTFGDDWDGSGAPAMAGADLLWSPGAEQTLLDLIGSARHSILIENEEMDEPYIEGALEAAARRGVKVMVVMTADPTYDEAFSELRQSGVVIRLFPSSYRSLYIHAKVIDVDPGYADARVFVGSENFSVASLLYNRELGIVTSEPAIVDELASMVLEDAKNA